MTNIVYTLNSPKENKEANPLKISVVMQSFLGEYPGSRKNPEVKFKRAVNSFLNQTNKNTELVIVSDGCQITEKLWRENYQDESRIKFIYVEKEGKNMYQEEEGIKFYRGRPRQAGVDISTGDIITYMDSDDFLMVEYLEVLRKYWESISEIDWLMNQGWWDNVEMFKNPVDGYYSIFENGKEEDLRTIQGLESQWIPSRMREKKIIMSPALTSHRKSCTTKWQDSVGNSEDKDFNTRLRKDYIKGGLFWYPGYVRCHLRDKWDW